MRRTAGPLGVPAFRSVWLSGLVSDTGDWLLFIALPLVVLRLSGSAFGTSVAFLLELVPGALLTPVAAWCAERLDPRRFLASVAAAQGLALLPLLAVPTLPRSVGLVVVYAVIVVESALTAVSDPARNALLPRLVPEAELVRANSLVGLAQNASRLVGGPLGGVVYALGGLPAVAGADLASYLVAAALIVRMRSAPMPAPTADGAERPPASTAAVLRVPEARRLLAVTFGCQVAQGMFLVLFVLFVVRGLSGGPADVGLLRGVQAVGAIAAALGLTAVARHASPPAMVAWSAVAFGVVSLAIWNGPHVTTSVGPYVVLFALAGAPGVVLGTGLTSGLQLGVDRPLHGRAFALAGLASYAGQGVGIVAAGTLAGPWGLPTLLDVQAGVYLAVGLAAVVRARISGRACAGPVPRGPAARRAAPRAARASTAPLPTGSRPPAGS